MVLSQFHPADAALLCEADRDPEHRRRFEIPEAFVPSLEHALAVITLWAQEHVDGTRYVFAVRDVATGTLLGGCELRPLGDGAANLSYWTYPPHRRRGVAARAIALACTTAFDDFGFRRLEAVIDPDNLGSRRAVTRNGFEEAGLRNGRLLYIATPRVVSTAGAEDSMTTSPTPRDQREGRVAIGSIVILCHEWERMLAFWRAALGYEIGHADPKGGFVILRDPRGRGPNVSLDRVPAPRTGKRSRLHLDLYTTRQRDEVERLVGLGARRYPWRYPEGADYVVLEDPDGSLFCVVQVPG